MNTKIYYYLILALIISIIGVLAFQNTPSQIQDTNIPVVIDTGTIVNTGSTDSGSLVTGTQENSLVYTNTEYGFQLTLPAGWEDYKVFIYTGSTIESGVSILFALPTLEKTRPGVMDPNDPNRFISGYTGQYQYIKGYADMLMLNIWTHEGYKQAINTPHVTRNKEVRVDHTRGSGSKYVYTIDGPNDWPDDIYQKRKKRDFQGVGNYFGQIKNTFKIL